MRFRLSLLRPLGYAGQAAENAENFTTKTQRHEEYLYSHRGHRDHRVFFQTRVYTDGHCYKILTVGKAIVLLISQKDYKHFIMLGR